MCLYSLSYIGLELLAFEEVTHQSYLTLFAKCTLAYKRYSSLKIDERILILLFSLFIMFVPTSFKVLHKYNSCYYFAFRQHNVRVDILYIKLHNMFQPICRHQVCYKHRLC
jgi:hypothetical protein